MDRCITRRNNPEFLIAVPGDAAALKPNRVDVEYMLPKLSAHDSLYKLVRERRLLEKLRDLLTPFRPPRRLFLKPQGCDGGGKPQWLISVGLVFC
jgi:hypothetical protein